MALVILFISWSCSLEVKNGIQRPLEQNTTRGKLNLITQKCVKNLNVEQTAVLLLEDQDEKSAFKTKVRRVDSLASTAPFRFDTQLTGWMLKNRKPLLVNDFTTDDRFRSFSKELIPIRSMLSVPLMSKGRMIGQLTVFNKKLSEGFSMNDQRLLTIIAAQSAQVIENARLLEEEQALLKMKEELNLAYRIQTKLLPKSDPQINGYDICGKSIPAKIVGGDYFDFLPMDEQRLVICLGDVSGKGIPAAMIMSNLQATVRAQTAINACIEY